MKTIALAITPPPALGLAPRSPNQPPRPPLKAYPALPTPTTALSTPRPKSARRAQFVTMTSRHATMSAAPVIPCIAVKRSSQEGELCRINVGYWASIYTVKSNGQDAPGLYPQRKQDDDRNQRIVRQLLMGRFQYEQVFIEKKGRIQPLKLRANNTFRKCWNSGKTLF